MVLIRIKNQEDPLVSKHSKRTRRRLRQSGLGGGMSVIRRVPIQVNDSRTAAIVACIRWAAECVDAGDSVRAIGSSSKLLMQSAPVLNEWLLDGNDFFGY
jgi:hypothetical protein